jgi:DNA-binding MarR family transcriptional regulator
MSEVEIVLSALPRIIHACRVRGMVAGGANVSAHQGQLLNHLDRAYPAMVTELAASMGVTPSNMSINLKRLR